jgi:Zn finger protein HypA/HybF involved in hydrogenase expression
MMKPNWNSQARCPRCHGNLGLEYDPPGSWDVVCLQCGFRNVAVNQGQAVESRALFRTESMRVDKAA